MSFDALMRMLDAGTGGGTDSEAMAAETGYHQMKPASDLLSRISTNACNVAMLIRVLLRSMDRDLPRGAAVPTQPAAQKVGDENAGTLHGNRTSGHLCRSVFAHDRVFIRDHL